MSVKINQIELVTQTQRVGVVSAKGVSMHDVWMRWDSSEPKLGNEDMDIDDVFAGLALLCQITHGQLQDSGERANQTLCLAHNSWRKQIRQMTFVMTQLQLGKWVELYCPCGSTFTYLHFYLHKYLNIHLYWSSDEENMSTLTVCGHNKLVKLEIVHFSLQ